MMSWQRLNKWQEQQQEQNKTKQKRKRVCRSQEKVFQEWKGIPPGLQYKNIIDNHDKGIQWKVTKLANEDLKALCENKLFTTSVNNGAR